MQTHPSLSLKAPVCRLTAAARLAVALHVLPFIHLVIYWLVGWLAALGPNL